MNSFAGTTFLRRGFFTMDAFVGLALLAVLATVLAVAVTRQAGAAHKLAADRAAARDAEATLIALQSSQSSGASVAPGVATVVTSLNAPAPVRWRWVRLDRKIPGSSNDTRSVSLIGLVPAEATSGGGQ